MKIQNRAAITITFLNGEIKRLNDLIEQVEKKHARITQKEIYFKGLESLSK